MAENAKIKQIQIDSTTYDIEPADQAEGTAVTVVTGISGGGVNKTTKYLHKTTTNAAPNGHTHSYTPSGTVGLGSNTTASGGVQYIESVGTFSAGTTPPASATPTHTATATNANSGTKVVAVTGYPDFSGGALTGTTTFVTDRGTFTAGSGSLESYDAATNGNKKVANGTRIPYVAAQGTITGASYTPDGSVTLNAGTAPSLGDATTRYLSAAPSNESTATGSATVATGGTTKYLSVSRTTSGSGTGARSTLVFTSGGDSAVSGAAMNMAYTESVTTGTHTHTYDKTTGVSLAANAETATGRITYVQAQGTFTAGTTPPASASFSGTAATITPTISDPTIYYLAHSHSAPGLTAQTTKSVGFTAASLGDPSTGDAAPNGHTHSYSKTTGITLTAGTAPSLTDATIKYFHPSFTGTQDSTGVNSGTAVAAITGLAANTSSASGDITYLENVTHTNAAVSSVVNVIKAE